MNTPSISTDSNCLAFPPNNFGKLPKNRLAFPKTTAIPNKRLRIACAYPDNKNSSRISVQPSVPKSFAKVIYKGGENIMRMEDGNISLIEIHRTRSQTFHAKPPGLHDGRL